MHDWLGRRFNKKVMLSLKRFFKSFFYAFRGLAKAWKGERNLRVESVIGIMILVAGFFFGIKPIEWCLLIFVIGLVILMELANSAVERISDILKPRIHSYVKDIKDIAAASVMISAVMSIIIGLIVFIPYIKIAF